MNGIIARRISKAIYLGLFVNTAVRPHDHSLDKHHDTTCCICTVIARTCPYPHGHSLDESHAATCLCPHGHHPDVTGNPYDSAGGRVEEEKRVVSVWTRESE